MGAVSFSLDERLVAALKTGLPLQTFVETGTFKGDTLARMAPHFDALHSAELSIPFFNDAAARFADEPKIAISNAHSPDFLARLNETLEDASTLYWLDAHWCAVEDVAGETSQCPLLAELRAIGSLPDSSVILIDDARLFLAPPVAPHEISQWPRFHDIVTGLLALSSVHEIMVINDVIAFFPSRIRPLMEAYAQTEGIDWIAAAGRVRDLLENEAVLRQKETFIQSMATSMAEKETELQSMSQSLVDKEEFVQAISRSLLEKEAALQDMARSLVEKEHVIQDLAATGKAARKARLIAAKARHVAATRVGGFNK